MMECTYKLKWLNGPLSGRELALPAGELRLGGTDPDIALSLEQDIQAILSIDDTGITLVSATPVWVAGRFWDLEQALPLGGVIDVAGQAFVLGTSTDELPTLVVPVRLAPSAERRSRWSLWCAGGIGVVAVFAVALVFWQPAPAASTFNLDAWLALQLENPELSGLSVIRDAQGGLVLKGMCRSSPSVDGLRLRLREKGLYVHDESVCADTLRQSVLAVLTLNGYRDVEVRSGEMLDHVVILGAIVADRAWQQASAQLQTISALGGWTVVNDHSEMFNGLLARLTTRHLLDGLSIITSDKTLRVSGQLDPQRIQAVAEVIKTFNQDGPPRLLAAFQNIPGAPSASQFLPSAIVSIGGNADSTYVQLANGMRLQKGSVLPSGYLIHALNRSAIALLKGQELVSLPLDL
ncbi:type III secretion system inner membrane ring subunit SctD [Pseudomonas sp. 6D_7.1_Bac1]|jgi:type III secretion protein D|uniref:type III secretion system inner membrane ring subunit SctD n=1 Tax=Pseudomonas sp. 6D_7.1_Bac1 TaxID=2971615 RepID=UPI0021C85AC9|nr:type III secretion system inner membrane ring subunit SctD [Pseudomonas sp. 6D_7.1_Bac1]MCU1748807.1 type III secretion system inner membrane ring subunit SctD [Pseudomonas sp. 6D_7.1_Bac1]